MKALSLILLLCSLIFNTRAQNVDYKAEAINVSKTGNYKYAIELLQKAKIENPNDPEIYYYLGVFMHYLAYDSTPLAQYDSTYTNKVIPFFNKAIELRPDYGDAFYFIGAQYGAKASDAMRNGNPKEYVKAFKEGYDAGGYPAWLLEYDRNILKSCDTNAILFVGGDAEMDPIQISLRNVAS